jgi:hypothetical protein
MVGGVTRFNGYLKLQHASQEEKMAFNTYVARVSSIMNRGIRDSKIAVLYPIESLWPKFQPVPGWIKNWDDMAEGDPDARKTSELFDRVSDHLYENQWEFSYIDSKGIMESTIKDGNLQHGNLKWEILILPGVETLKEEVMRVIENFIKSGGKVIALEALPENSDHDFPSRDISRISKRLFHKYAKSENAIYLEEFTNEVFQDILKNNIHRDYVFEPAELPVLCSQKKVDDFKVLLVINDSNEQEEFTISFDTKAEIEKWDPNSGIIEKVRNPVEMQLNAYDGVIFRYKK